MSSQLLYDVNTKKYAELVIGTAFRVRELRSLTPESFALDTEPATVTVQAAYSKHRKTDVQLVRSDLVELLRVWLKGREAGEPAFNMPDKPYKMIRVDLEAAGISYRDSAGRVRGPPAVAVLSPAGTGGGSSPLD